MPLRRIGFTLVAAAVALLGATPAPAPAIGVTVQTVRTSYDLLDTLAVEVIAHNPSSQLQSATFAQPIEYQIDVSRDGKLYFSSLPASPPPGVVYTPHARAFNSGPTPIVLYDWNGITRDKWSPLPGEYTVRVTLLDTARPSATMKVKFMPPLPTTVLSKLKPNEEVTLAGRLDATRSFLTDSNGTITLSRRLIAAPSDFPIVVRGYPTDHPDGTRTFTFERWAALGEPLPTPPPMPAPVQRPVLRPRPTPTARLQ
jgi:hypothetical protein